MLNRIKAEPALFSGLVVVLLNLAAAFGLNLSGEQTAAINAAVAAVLAFFVRAQVTPVDGPPDEAGEVGLVQTLVLVVLVLVVLVLIGHPVHVG